ncbi:MAG: 3-hydroxybutyryl-CoA dehydrogenase [Deltaproteobacteria bacterium]|nr:3-hydroxybutyryl-CoA dehydrogenase [Deltaproteobacteria bacterium]MBI2341416.1 3-hydroxybutyryl-CoA dehydrogenase [Deltaproteobacteria bacterium]
MTVNTIGVIGAGQMGSGIAQVFAMAGFKVIMQDVKDEFVAKGLSVIKNSLAKFLEKQKISQEIHNAALANIKTTLNLKDMADCDIIIEAAPEDINLKLEVFKKLDEAVKKDAILATNTSSISIAKIAGVTRRPDKVIGMHFMNPVPVMQCVEIIRSSKTSEATYDCVKELVKKLGKTAVTASDSPGFIMNRILIPMINEAISALHENVATAEDIDTGCKLSFNWPMGPLALADLIGLDTCLAIQRVLYKEFKDEKYKPCAMLEECVNKGWLGRKTKRGFYLY